MLLGLPMSYRSLEAHPDIRSANGDSIMVISTASTCNYNVDILFCLCCIARPISITMALQGLCYTKQATSPTGSSSQVHRWKPLRYFKTKNIACASEMERKIWLVEFVAFFFNPLSPTSVPGDIVYIEALGSPIVILNTFESANALLGNRGANYSRRPIFTFAGELMGANRVSPSCIIAS
jgi:hypothetical protein